MLAEIVYGRWRLGIGDPTFLGWLTAVAYLVAAAMCIWAGRQTWQQRRFWMAMGIFMFVLGVNKQLDLQTWFTEVGRTVALEMGWYENRRIVQGLFVAVMIGVGALGLLGIWMWARRAPKATRWGACGGAFLVCFIIIRAASFHHVDQFLGHGLGQARFNHVLELGGIGMVIYGTLLTRRQRQQQRAALGPSSPSQFIWMGPGS